MEIDSGQRIFTIEKVDSYDESVAFLEDQHGIQVTCLISTKLSIGANIEEIKTEVENLCALMSIARATLINWIAFDIVGQVDGQSIYSGYQNAITRQYSGNELIDHKDYMATKRFLEVGLGNFQNLDSLYNIRRLSRAYIDTKIGPFLETRTLIMAATLEYLANILTKKEKAEPIIKKNIFEKRWKDANESLKKVLKECFPEIIEERVDDILIGVKKGMNQKSLGERIDLLVRSLGLSFSEDERAEFVRVRNHLAHTGSFPDGDLPANYYFRMQHLLDRVLLRLFDYKGMYFDIDHKEQRSLI
jgi:hypothetical protein